MKAARSIVIDLEIQLLRRSPPCHIRSYLHTVGLLKSRIFRIDISGPGSVADMSIPDNSHLYEFHCSFMELYIHSKDIGAQLGESERGLLEFLEAYQVILDLFELWNLTQVTYNIRVWLVIFLYYSPTPQVESYFPSNLRP